LGWITSKGRWSIQQATINWHGSGAGPFAREVTGWRRRYRGVESLHHRSCCLSPTGTPPTLAGAVLAMGLALQCRVASRDTAPRASFVPAGC
jgi:hypothetical protein